VSAASASRWSRRLRQTGQVAPKPMGGDRVSHRMEAHARLILATCRRQPTLFLRELREHLARRGVQTSTSGLSRFFARHGITRKKGRHLPPSRTART
jgi:transposase